MTPTGIAFLGLRLAALYVWIYALIQVANQIPMLLWHADETPWPWSNDQELFDLYLLISPLLLIVLGIVLFVWAPVWARRMFPESPSAPADGTSGIEGLALRLLGIWVMTWTFAYVPNVLERFQFMQSASERATFDAAVIVVLTLAALGTCLIVLGPRLARWLLRASAAASPPPPRAQTIAFSVVGILVLLDGLPDVMTAVVIAIYSKLGTSVEIDIPLEGDRWWGEAWVSVGRVVFGLVLFLGGQGLASIWSRLRNRGLAAARRENESRPV